jgi:hypothetical protein
MWILLLEAGGALSLLIFLVWWTMFSGRQQDGPREDGRERALPPARKENDTPEP